MMQISSREKLIIEKLLNAHDEITVNDLAKEIKVSARTIHRDLNGLEKWLEKYALRLVRKTGVGIQMTGSAANKERLKRQLMTLTLHEFMAEERQTLILSMLYEAAGPVKLFTLANELQVTVATISNDLLKLEEKLLDFDLSIIRKRGYGIELGGSEESKRRAISYNLSKSLSEDEFLSLIQRNRTRKNLVQENAIADRLLHIVDREKVLVIEEVIRQLNPKLLSAMTDSAYVGLIVHLTLAIDRMMRGEKIEMAEDFLMKLQRTLEYKVAKELIEQLAIRFNIEIPEAEIGYITMHLQGAKLRAYKAPSLENDYLQIAMRAKQLIQEVETKTHCELTNHAPLLEGLITHLTPAMYRIRKNMKITNPLLKNIRKDYGALFEIVKAASEKVFPNTDMPDEEIGFLVLHFGAAILGAKKEGNLKAYVVCASGIGTSKMLATQLRREISSIKEVENVSAFTLHELSISENDLILSTIHLEDAPFDYLVVNPFLTEEDIQQIQLFAKRKALLQKPVDISEEPFPNVESMTERMRKFHDYTETMATILSHFTVTEMKKEKSISAYVNDICLILEQSGMIQDANAIAKALFAREALGGLGIPGTSLALFHTKHSAILKPSFTIYTIREPISIGAMDGSDIQLQHILLLLAPGTLHVSGMEVLSLISETIIESAESMQLFQSGDEAKIHAHLGRKFEAFLQEKIS